MIKPGKDVTRKLQIDTLAHTAANIFNNIASCTMTTWDLSLECKVRPRETNSIYRVNKMKDRKHMSIPTDAAKALEKTQRPSGIRTPE